MQTSSAPCRLQPKPAALLSFPHTSKKRRSEISVCALFICCRWLRQATFEVLAPVLSCGQGNFPMAGGSSVFSTSAWQTALAAHPSASRFAEEQFVGQPHLLPGTLLP